jgi:hypothetical protein
LLPFHPVILVARAGLVLSGAHTALLVAIGVPVLVQLYIISSWHWLSFGANFGHRGFMTGMLPCLIGLANFAREARPARSARAHL